MTNPVLVEVTRGPAVESVHRGRVAVVDASGAVIKGLGDIETAVFPRSAWKPLQAIPLVASGAATAFGLGDVELALACASHAGMPIHVNAVMAWLTRIGAAESDLACGPHPPADDQAAEDLIRAGAAPGRRHNNCSGKHAGFLTLAKHRGLPLAAYETPGGPVQAEVRSAIGRFCGVDLSTYPAGTDGCHAPAFMVPLRHLALGAARLATGANLSAGDAQAARTLMAAMRALPEFVAGPGRLTTALLGALTDGVVKEGAEGVYIAALPHLGFGLALKIDDGAKRAAETALVAILVALGALPASHPLAGEREPLALFNTRGLLIGHCRAAPALRF